MVSEFGRAAGAASDAFGASSARTQFVQSRSADAIAKTWRSIMISPSRHCDRTRNKHRQTLPVSRTIRRGQSAVNLSEYSLAACLHQIQPPNPLPGRAALGTDAANDQAMPSYLELVLAGNGLAKSKQLVA